MRKFTSDFFISYTNILKNYKNVEFVKDKSKLFCNGGGKGVVRRKRAICLLWCWRVVGVNENLGTKFEIEKHNLKSVLYKEREILRRDEGRRFGGVSRGGSIIHGGFRIFFHPPPLLFRFGLFYFTIGLCRPQEHAFVGERWGGEDIQTEI